MGSFTHPNTTKPDQPCAGDRVSLCGSTSFSQCTYSIKKADCHADPPWRRSISPYGQKAVGVRETLRYAQRDRRGDWDQQAIPVLSVMLRPEPKHLAFFSSVTFIPRLIRETLHPPQADSERQACITPSRPEKTSWVSHGFVLCYGQSASSESRTSRILVM